MATLIREPNGRKRIQFVDGNGARRSIGLGHMTDRNAERFKDKVEQLVEHVSTGMALEAETSRWLLKLAARWYVKLVQVELVEPRITEADAPKQTTVLEFIADYLRRRSDLKGTSVVVYEHVQRNLTDFFGESKRLSEVTAGDAVDFGRSLAGDSLSKATIDRRMSLAATIFSDAVRHEHIPANPFDGWRKPLKNVISRTNKSRQRFITREVFEKLIEFAPDAEWRLLLALARIGGLRVPSEPLSLQWSHIDWQRGRMQVPCPKLEHVEGRESREVPIFGDLLPYLEDCWHNAEPNAEWVIAQHRPLSVRNGDGWRGANLRTMLHKIIRRAGFKPWPRAWNNLRASRATELAEEFPGHVAAAWLGHTEEIADAHYRQVLPGHFERAIIATTSKSETVHQTVHDAVQSTVHETVPHGVAVHRTELQTPHNHLTPCELAQEKAVTCENMRPLILEAGGIEPPSCDPSTIASTCVVR